MGRSEELMQLINLACEKYQMAVNINNNYTNAFNSWALALSTRAKMGWSIEASR